jgi:prepilin-type N-terminal cleavage/methylation domain-containing protein
VIAEPEETDADAGFTLVELMVAIGIFLLLTTMIMTSVLSISSATTDVRQFTNINEQARIAIERLTRELRQASVIRSVSLPLAAGGDTALTFGVDFNGNQAIDDVTADPEVLTYRYDSVNHQLTLTANDETGNAITRPILSEEVSAFTLGFRSSLWQYDGCLATDQPGAPTGPKDGLTDWTELNTLCGGGNNNGALDGSELAKIDLVVVTLSVLEGTHQQTYQTQVGLRNNAQS